MHGEYECCHKGIWREIKKQSFKGIVFIIELIKEGHEVRKLEKKGKGEKKREKIIDFPNH